MNGKPYALRIIIILLPMIINGCNAATMESIGFLQEGILRRSMFRDGQWRDIVIYGILRSDVSAETK